MFRVRLKARGNALGDGQSKKAVLCKDDERREVGCKRVHNPAAVRPNKLYARPFSARVKYNGRRGPRPVLCVHQEKLLEGSGGIGGRNCGLKVVGVRHWLRKPVLIIKRRELG